MIFRVRSTFQFAEHLSAAIRIAFIYLIFTGLPRLPVLNVDIGNYTYSMYELGMYLRMPKQRTNQIKWFKTSGSLNWNFDMGKILINKLKIWK